MKINYKNIVLAICSLGLLVSCNEDPKPKPKAYLALEYPEAIYKTEDITKMPFTFDRNALGKNLKTKTLKGETTSYGINIEYPNLKGTIYITYKALEHNEKLLRTYLINAQNFTQEHTQKADVIDGIVYENPERKVYGMFYDVGGNAASQSQFYVTDSINHFITGSLYFYAKPNYDSILPAANYLQKDIMRIMESLEWKK
ncbi:gliding motility lipoprotein GldD [uncultured Lacinutrix sp.]|uniref:gliding motility lipoprotein GldD n=1 Tax=uncultured Lacinutrix sp. TaxID=574032 RepID=UPI0026219012|nr:gliding motility lipoprotein GldD [uncultured Lacinutrix sp.]